MQALGLQLGRADPLGTSFDLTDLAAAADLLSLYG